MNISSMRPMAVRPVNKNKDGKKMGKFSKVIIALVLLLLIAVGASALGGGAKNTGSKDNAATDTSNAAQSPTQDQAPPKAQTQNPAQTQTPPINNNQPSTASKITAWDSKYGYMFQNLENDFNQMSKDANNGDVSAVGSDCQQINSDVTTAQGFPAIPDAQSASDYSSALTYYQEGSSECVTAINNSDANGIIQAAQLISQGTDKINATSTDISKVAGQ